MFLFWLILIVLICSWLLTWGLRSYARHISLLDIPNQRSSHSVPVPRGGGLAIVISFLGALLMLNLWYVRGDPITIALLVSGLCVAVLGFWDDMYTVSAKFRLCGHLAAAVFAIYWLGGMPAISIFGWSLHPGIVLNSLGVLYLIWLLNLYNFMDGIDGLAGVEAVCVCLGAALLYWLTDSNSGVIILPLLLAAAVAGFLYWNFPPARIFMGDVGSGFLGIILAILSLQATVIDAQFFWCWLILLGVFIVDATVTLLRRAFQGDKIYEAHCSHAYQHASRRFNSHLLITLAVLAINIVWLLPIAIVVVLGYAGGVTGLLVAYFPLIILAVKFNAGKTSEMVDVASNC